MDHVHDAVFILDGGTNRVVDVNAEACVHLGYAREELLGASLLDIDLRMRDPDVRDMVTQALGSAGLLAFRGVHRRKDGSTYPVEVSARRVERGGRSYVVAVARDLSERLKLEERIIRAERLAAVGTLASGVAHEFNNINVLVRGYCDLGLRRKGLDATIRGWLERVRQATERATRITNDLLTLSRVRGPSELSADLVAAVAQALGLLEAELARAEVTVERRLDPVPPTALDPGLMGQVVVNLVLNAIHSLVDRPVREMTVSTGLEGRRIFLRVRDTGCGVAEEDLARIFSPFFSTKGETGGGAQASVKGTGLGLSVSNTIVEEHGGEIAVESVVGQGSCFTVWLPVTTGL